MASSKQPKRAFLNFYIELRMKPIGVGLNLALPKKNSSGDPRFFILYSERYYSIP